VSPLRGAARRGDSDGRSSSGPIQPTMSLTVAPEDVDGSIEMNEENPDRTAGPCGPVVGLV
jgi:hypothetical protein